VQQADYYKGGDPSVYSLVSADQPPRLSADKKNEVMLLTGTDDPSKVRQLVKWQNYTLIQV